MQVGFREDVLCCLSPVLQQLNCFAMLNLWTWLQMNLKALQYIHSSYAWMSLQCWGFYLFLWTVLFLRWNDFTAHIFNNVKKKKNWVHKLYVFRIFLYPHRVKTIPIDSSRYMHTHKYLVKCLLVDAFACHQQVSCIILHGYFTTFLDRIGMCPGTDLAFKRSPQIFSRVEVGASGRPFQKPLAIKLSPKRHLVCPCGQLQISVKLEGGYFGAVAAFLVSILSAHGQVKRVFWQFLVHGRPEPLWFLGCS